MPYPPLRTGNPARWRWSRAPRDWPFPVIVLGEYRLGIAQSRHRAEYEKWLREWITAVMVLDVDQETAHHYATIGLELKRAGKPIPVNDLWIAALCRQHALPLASRDRHFDWVAGIQRVDW